MLRVDLTALQPENIKVPLMAHVGTEDKFFPSKVTSLEVSFLQEQSELYLPSALLVQAALPHHMCINRSGLGWIFVPSMMQKQTFRLLSARRY